MGWAGYLVQTPAGAAGPSCARLLEFQRAHPASEQQATPGLVKVQLGTQSLAAAVAEQGQPAPYTVADAQAPQVPALGTGVFESGPAGAASALVQLSSAAPAAEDIPVAMNGAACAIMLPTEPPAKKPRLTARKHDSVGAQWEAACSCRPLLGATFASTDCLTRWCNLQELADSSLVLRTSVSLNTASYQALRRGFFFHFELGVIYFSGICLMN